MPERSVSVRLRAEIGGYVNGLRRAGGATREFGRELVQNNEAAGNLAETGAGLGAALAGGFVLASKAALDFEAQMSSVKSATQATGAQFDKMREQALAAGESTIFSATEAAAAQEELAKAGLTTADILSGGLSGALALAAAGEMSVAEAAETAATAMSQFALSGQDVGHIADLLAATAGKAQGSVHDAAQALNQAGLVAHQFNISIEETTGVLAAFAKQGLIGSDAGTSLKTMLLMLANPSEKASNLMRELGIHAYDAQGNFVGLADLAGQLQMKLGGLTQSQRDSTLATIFGSDAIRAANVLYSNGAGGIREWTRAVDEQGYAADTAAEKTDNLAGDIEKLKGSIETLMIESGSGPGAGLRQLVQMGDRIVQSLSQVPPEAQTAVMSIGGITGAGLLASAAMLKLGAHMSDTLQSMRDLGPRGARAATALGNVGKFAAKAAVAIVALQVASAAAGSSVDAKTDLMAKSLKQFADTGQLAGESARVFGKDLELLEQGMVDLLDTGWWSDNVRTTGGFIEGLTGAGSLYDKSLQHSKERLNALDAGLAQLVQSGNTKAAEEAFNRIAAAAAKHGVSVNELKTGLPQYAAALDGAMASTTKAIEVTEKARITNQLMLGSLNQMVDALGSFEDAWDRVHGAVTAFAEAEIGAEAALDDLAEKLKENGRSLDINTEKGRDNKSAMLDVIDAAKEAAEAKYQETGSVEEASRVYQSYIDRLRATLRAAGLTQAQIDGLIGTYAKMPAAVATEIQTPGLSAARAAVEAYIRRLNELRRAQGLAPRRAGNVPEAFRWGGVVEHAEHGLLRQARTWGPGSTLYGWREPATMGEAFIPKRGDRTRSLSILDKAASWYGATVRPQVPMVMPVAAAGGNTTHTVDLRLNGEAVRKIVIKAAADRGMNVSQFLKVA